MNRKKIAAIALAGAVTTGAGASVVLPTLAGGQTPTTTPAPPGGGKHGFRGGPQEAARDLSVAAQAIGMSEADLMAALKSGQNLAQVAQAHNVAVQKVIDALVADEKKELSDAVAAGKLTQAQADQKGTGIVDRVTARVNGQAPAGKPGPGNPGFGAGKPGSRSGPDAKAAPGFRPGPGGAPAGGGFAGPGLRAGGVNDLSVAAHAIGISEADLMAALKSGQNLAQVAQAHDVAALKVVDALVAAEKKALADAVAAGKLTQAQADQKGAGIAEHVTAEVNGQFPKGGPGPRPR